MHNTSEFRIGNYRPIYLWAGPGTIRMNKLKFMQVDVDEEVHQIAHQTLGARNVVHEMFQNWIHLTYSWGFPPEIEKEDWDSFEQASIEYHNLDSKVFAYIQTSNCVFDGSFTQKEWYALTPQRKKVYYYSGRYMTCFQNDDWLKYLQTRIEDAIHRGADGIFFDNLWYGLQPNSLFNTWLGGAGCYCDSCQKIHFSETGHRIPPLTDLKNVQVKDYILWRAEKMTLVIKKLSDFARSIKPDVVISANDYDPVMRPVKLIFGIDFPSLAKIQDVTMIENFALPKWVPSPNHILVNNAITVRNSQAFLPEDKHISVLSYDAGIGFDPVYPTRRIITAMSEAAALGCSMTTKGTEYHDGKKMTLLTASEYKEQQESIGSLHRWLEEHQNIYQNQKERVTNIALLHPGDLLWQNWHQLAPLFFAIQQTLLVHATPWKVITNLKEAKDSDQIITFDNQSRHNQTSEKNEIIHALTLESWEHPSESFLNRHTSIRNFSSEIADGLIRSYHASKSMRKLMDWLGMSKLVTHTPFFQLPPQSFQNEIMNLINNKNNYRVNSQYPVLMDIWKTTNNEINIHLVNYCPQPQKINLIFESQHKIKVISPNKPTIMVDQLTKELELDLDIYLIIKTEMNEEIR